MSPADAPQPPAADAEAPPPILHAPYCQ